MLSQDLKYVLRSLVKRPGFTLAILLILALGIGATTAIFSVTDAIVLRPLPYPDPDRLMYFYESYIGQEADTSSVAYLDYIEWKERNKSFEEMAASAFWLRLNLTGREQPERVHVNFVSANYFKVLSAQPLLGRGFQPDEDRAPAGAPVAVLANGFWKRYFGGDPNVLGKTVSLNEHPVTVVGVLPESFHDLSKDTEIFLPVTSSAVLMSPSYLESRPNRWLHPVARLKPGVTMEQAKADLDAIAASIAERYPENQGIGAKFEPVSRMIFNFLDLRTSTLAMMIAAALLMLICCINVANLLILRSMERQREIALRLTLGSSHLRLVRQLVVESLALALLGGALGLFLGYIGTRILVRVSALDLPAFAEITVNPRVVAMSLLVSVAMGLIFGLLPAMRSRKADLRESLTQGAAQAGGARRDVGRRLLIVAEVALALVLLLNAGLMVKSFNELRGDQVGVDSDHLLVMRMDLDSPRYTERETRRVFADELLERARNLPGATASGLWGPGVPGAEAHFGFDLLPEVSETADTQEEARFVRRHHITPGALKDLGITLRKGREFTAADTADQPRVAVVSETMAREFWPGQDAIGKRFKPALPPGAPEIFVTVVGITADVRHGGRVWESQEPFARDVYIPLAQSPERQLTLWLRTEQDAATLGPELRRLVQSIDPNLPVFDLSTMAERRHTEEAQFRFRAILVTLFAVVALVLTSVGIYTVLAYAVSQRTREIGIRSALGAQNRDVLGLIMSQGLVLFVAGAIIGLAGAAFSRRLVSTLLYGITPNDPSTWIAILAVLAAVTLVAIYIPARRALKVEPVVALKYD